MCHATSKDYRCSDCAQGSACMRVQLGMLRSMLHKPHPYVLAAPRAACHCLEYHDCGTGKDIYGEGFQAVMGEMLTQGSSYAHVAGRRIVWLKAMLPLLQVRMPSYTIFDAQHYCTVQMCQLCGGISRA